jgi:hypothetical protein
VDMHLQHLVEPGENVIISMSDSHKYEGHFQSYTFPYAPFVLFDGRTIYIQIDQICVLEPKKVSDRN